MLVTFDVETPMHLKGRERSSSEEVDPKKEAFYKWLRDQGCKATPMTLGKELRRLGRRLRRSGELTVLIEALPADQRTPVNGSALPKNAGLFDVLAARFGRPWRVRGKIKLPLVTVYGHILSAAVAAVIPIQLIDPNCLERMWSLDKALESMEL